MEREIQSADFDQAESYLSQLKIVKAEFGRSDSRGTVERKLYDSIKSESIEPSIGLDASVKREKARGYSLDRPFHRRLQEATHREGANTVIEKEGKMQRDARHASYAGVKRFSGNLVTPETYFYTHRCAGNGGPIVFQLMQLLTIPTRSLLHFA